MEFFSRYFVKYLNIWIIPLVLLFVGFVGPNLYTKYTGKNKSDEAQSKDTPKSKIIPYGVGTFVLFMLVSTFVLTLDDEPEDRRPDINEDISITDSSFSGDVRGLASLYDNELLPFWYESDLADVCLELKIDNSGTTHATIEKAKLIIDDFTPITTEEILVCSLEHYSGDPDVVEANIDLYDISSGSSEYDLTYSTYIDGKNGIEHSMQKGHSFYIEPSKMMYLSVAPGLNRTGKYTYHFELDVKYNKEETLKTTDPVSFIYVDGEYKDYKYNETALNSFYIDREYRSDDSYQSIYYTIDKRTLRIHDTKTVFSQNDLCYFFALIDTIIVEDGTEEIEEEAFRWGGLGLQNAKTMYLPNSLKSLAWFDCFIYFNQGKLKEIYFGGTKEEWDALERNPDNNWKDSYEYSTGKDIFDDVRIIYNCDIYAFEDEISSKPVDVQAYHYEGDDISEEESTP